MGVTGATLYVTQQSLEHTQQRLFKRLTELKVANFQDVQHARLGNARQKCRSFSRSVRLRGIMERYLTALDDEDEDDIKEATEILYLTAEDELRDVLKSDDEDPGTIQAAFFRFLDVEGEVLIPPPGTDAGFKIRAGREYFQEQLPPISEAMEDVQVIVYLAPPKRSGEKQILTVVVTLIIDVRFDEVLGALVIGFPVPEYSELPDVSVGEESADVPLDGESPNIAGGSATFPELLQALEDDSVQGGILLSQELYSKDIDGPLRMNLAREVNQQVKTTELTRHDFQARYEDNSYRVFHDELQKGEHFPAAYQVILFSLSESEAMQRANRLKVMAFGAVGLIFAFALSLFLSHGLAVPIQELVKGTGEIQRGNFDAKVPVRSQDEIGRLAGAFNEMADGLALKEKYRSVLDKVSDKAVAEKLMQGDVELGGETREISVLFCDIRGFTALTQGMDPDEVIRMLNEHFTPLTNVVAEHNGVVDKFVGDLIMAIFGAPESYESDAYNAARCAFEMICEREKLNKSSRYKIEVGIGVASGPALAGNMGSSDRLNYTVLGERVNLAARLCSKAGRNEVVIDQTTKERANDWLEIEPLEQLSLKGFSDPVPAYKLVNIRSYNKNV